MRPLISVLVPVYNVEKYLGECLDSILLQTYSTFEIILIDDGSTDASGNICDQYAVKDGRIRVFHKQNAGVAQARNDALSHAKGEYICFVDGDDYIDKTMLQRIHDIFEKVETDIINFGCVLVRDSGEVIEEHDIQDALLSREEALREIVEGSVHSYFCNKAFRKRILNGIKCPPGRVWEDMGTMYRIFLRAENVCCISDRLYYYRRRANSIVNTINEKALCDIFYFQKERYDVLKGIYPDIAELGFEYMALCAMRLYDGSLWWPVDNCMLAEAIRFLQGNKSKILALNSRKRYMLYFYNGSIYNICRKMLHRVGNIVRSFEKRFLK